MFALSLSLSGLQAQLDGEEQESEKTIGNAITQTQSKDNLNEYSTGDTLERVQKGNFVGARQKKTVFAMTQISPLSWSLYMQI